MKQSANIRSALLEAERPGFAVAAGRSVAAWRSVVIFRRPSQRSVLTIFLVVVVFALVIWPLIMLARGAFNTASPLETSGQWTLSGFSQMWEEINISHALVNSIMYSSLTTFFAVSVALVLCFLSERTDTPLRRLITPIMLVCAATSSLFYAIGYSLLANRFNGIINVALENLTGVSSLLNIESWPGLVFVDSLHSAAFLYLFLVGPFANMDRTLEEAALVAGASRLRTFFTVNVRLLTPILTSVVLMGLINGMKSFNIPLILGAPADISFLTVRILRSLQFYQPPQYSQASALALALTALVVVMLAVQFYIVGRSSYVTLTGRSFQKARWQLGWWRWPAAAFVLLYAVLGVALPLGAIVFSSFMPFPGVYDSLSLANYRSLFANPEINSVVFNTALAAVGAGFVGVGLSFLIAAVTSRSNRVLGALIRGTTQLRLAMPGLVGALALTWAVVTVPGLRHLYGTVWLLLIAFVVGVLPVSVQIASSAVRQIGTDLEDSARVAGASPLRAALEITARLLTPSLLFAWLLAMIAIVGDLDAPLLLSSAGTRTMSIQIYKLFDGVDQSQAAAMLTLLLAFIVGSVATFGAARGLSALLSRRRYATVLPLASGAVT